MIDLSKENNEQPVSQGLNKRLGDIEEKLQLLLPSKEETKSKPFKLRWGINNQLKSLGKKNKVLIFLLKTNRIITPITAKVEDGMIRIGEKLFNITPSFVYLFEGKAPAIVLPEWSLEPIGTMDYYDAVEKGKVGQDAQTIIIRHMKKAEVEGDGKNKVSGKMLIWILLGAAVVGYLLFAK